MAGEDPLSGAMISSAIASGIRFDRSITGFQFKPSLGIVAKQLQALGDEFRNLHEPLERSVREVMAPSIAQNFAVGGRPAWEELTYYTVRRRGSAKPILVRSGALAGVAGSPNIWSVGVTSAAIKDLPSSVWYGKVHQAGASAGAYGGGNWFKKYQDAARKLEGPEASDREVNDTAYAMFDKRLSQHGLAPSGGAEIPARPFAVFQEEDMDGIQLVFAEWMATKVASVGGFI